jgi:hypothetical protein
MVRLTGREGHGMPTDTAPSATARDQATQPVVNTGTLYQ